MIRPDDLIGAVDAHLDDVALERAPEVRVYDPLWLLFRQQQLGELDASDAGTAAMVRVAGDTRMLDAVRANDGSTRPEVPYDPANVPLEKLAENDAALPSVPLAAPNVRRGLALLRKLRALDGGAAVARELENQFPLPGLPQAEAVEADFDTLQWESLHKGRGLDAVAVSLFLTEFLASGDVAAIMADLSVPPDLHDPVMEVLTGWLPSMEHVLDHASGARVEAWQPVVNAYGFSVLADAPNGNRDIIEAEGYRGGQLDWFDFSYAQQLADPPRPASPAGWTRTAIPTPLAIRGMPAPRWWQVEDEAVDWGWLDPAPDDLARLIISDMALSYGGDWTLVPLDLPFGSLTRIEAVEVMDCFGESEARRPIGPRDPFRVFCITGSEQVAPAPFLLFPAAPTGAESSALEEVSFHPDEGANLCWAIERIAESAVTGRPVDRQQELAGRPHGRSVTIVPGEAELAYDIASDVPENWVPLLPASAPNHDRRLVGARLLNSDTGHIGSPRGAILAQPYLLDREQVPREGARVVRRRRRVRWQNGDVHVWSGRQQNFGHAKDGSSGLRYDRIVPKVQETGSPGAFTRMSVRDIARYLPEGRRDEVSVRAIFEKGTAPSSELRLPEAAVHLGDRLSKERT